MAFKISEMTAALSRGGARPTLFQVAITSPFDSSLTATSAFMVQSTQLPSSTVGAIEVPYFGRKIKVAGDRTFDSWQVNVLNDEDFKVRHALESWHNRINSLRDNSMGTSSSSPTTYKRDATVTQFSKHGEPIRVYKFFNMFPVELSTIDVDWNATDTIETFSAVFSYDWFEVVSGTAGQSSIQ